MLGKLNAELDKWLWARGIQAELPRRALCALVPLSGAATALGLILLPFTLQVLCFGLGAAFAGINLFFLTQTVARLLVKPAGSGRRLILLSFARFFITVPILLLIISYEPYAAIGLLAGFSTGFASLAVFGLTSPAGSQQISHKSSHKNPHKNICDSRGKSI